jgi:hypothetical protein
MWYSTFLVDVCNRPVVPFEAKDISGSWHCQDALQNFQVMNTKFFHVLVIRGHGMNLEWPACR